MDEKLRKRVDIKLVKTDGCENEKLRKIIAKLNFNRHIKFSDELSAIHVNKTKLTLNKPIYVGFSVLDLSTLDVSTLDVSLLDVRLVLQQSKKEVW